MAEAMPDWFAILICGGLATLLGLSVLLCAMILDDLVTLLLGCWLSAVVVIMKSRRSVPGANCRKG